MKVTYKVLTPLDGAGTILNPAFTWWEDERTEFCSHIQKAGELYYMIRGGYIFHSIDVTKITKIEDNGKIFSNYESWANTHV